MVRDLFVMARQHAPSIIFMVETLRRRVAALCVQGEFVVGRAVCGHRMPLDADGWHFGLSCCCFDSLLFFFRMRSIRSAALARRAVLAAVTARFSARCSSF
jgi:hypothetical protein